MILDHRFSDPSTIYSKRTSACLPIELILEVLQEVGVVVQGGYGTLHAFRHRDGGLEAGVEHESSLELSDGHLKGNDTPERREGHVKRCVCCSSR